MATNAKMMMSWDGQIVKMITEAAQGVSAATVRIGRVTVRTPICRTTSAGVGAVRHATGATTINTAVTAVAARAAPDAAGPAPLRASHARLSVSAPGIPMNAMAKMVVVARFHIVDRNRRQLGPSPSSRRVAPS